MLVSVRTALQRCCVSKRSSAREEEYVAFLDKLPSDFPSIDALFRKSVISCLLTGIRESLYQSLSPVQELRVSTSAQDSSMDSLRYLEPGYTFVDYFPDTFAKIRELSGISSLDYLKSLDVKAFFHELNLKVSDGKSGSFFCFSPDRKFIVKTIFRREAKLLESILPDLLQHFLREQNSLIAKFYGFHGVQVAYGSVVHVVVMQNAFDTQRKIHECYDLKGSWIGREVGEDHDRHPSMLGKDLDLKRKLRLSASPKMSFLSQIKNDAKFLSGLGIIDYSLLLGFHFCPPLPVPANLIAVDTNTSSEVYLEVPEQSDVCWSQGILSSDKREIYYLGIVDMLQQYDLRKQLEVCWKTVVLRKEQKGISAAPPVSYAGRFIQAMHSIVQ